MLGVVRYFDDERGAGYITPDAGGCEIFVHISAVHRAGLDTLNAGQRLRYRAEADRGGRPAAEDLAVV